MIIRRQILKKNILFVLFFISYLMMPVSLLIDFLEPYFFIFFTTGSIFLFLFFLSYVLSYYAIKRNYKNHINS
ncbi:hypothetical protein BH23BAC2_BH23BAC2_06770 [soil metagenome]